jgi:ribose transport system substrate-binding protein
MKKSRIMILTLAFVLVMVTALSGCTEKVQDTGSGADASAGAGTTPEGQTDYRDMGKVDAEQEDRSGLEKALNKNKLKKPEDITIGFSQFTMGNPYFAQEVKTAEAVSKEYGFNFIATDGLDDMQKQSSDFDTLISKGVDIIITDLKDPIGNVPDIQRAVDAGIPVIAVDGGIDQTAPIVTLITASPYDNGVECGKWMAANVSGDEVKAGIISGAVGNAVGEGRRFGMIAGIIEGQLEKLGLDPSAENIKKYSEEVFDNIRDTGKYRLEDLKFEIVNQGWGNWTDEGGLDAAEDIISGNPDINLIMTENDFMGLGAQKAVKAAGLEGKILLGSCADGSRNALDEIKAGTFGVTGYNNPIVYSRAAVDLAYKILVEGYDAQGLPFYTYSAAVAITAENVKEYYPDTKDNEYTKEVPIDFSALPKRRDV